MLFHCQLRLQCIMSLLFITSLHHVFVVDDTLLALMTFCSLLSYRMFCHFLISFRLSCFSLFEEKDEDIRRMKDAETFFPRFFRLSSFILTVCTRTLLSPLTTKRVSREKRRLLQKLTDFFILAVMLQLEYAIVFQTVMCVVRRF